MTMLTDDQRAIRELAREFADGEIVPRAPEWDRAGAFDRDVLDKLADLGFLGMLVPERYGGLELDLPTYLVAFEELARGDAALALTVAIQNGPVPNVLMKHATEEQKARWLPELASGAKIAGFALSEEGAGSDPSSMTTEARSVDGTWTITGRKKWVTNGARADVMLVFARTGGGESGMDLSRTLGKTPVEVRDFPGFVSNRVLMPMINEAVFALMEGVADAEAIDTVMTLGMNHPMGPLALADLIGLDTCLNILEVLHRELGDDRYRPCPLLRQYVAAGWLGRKTGRGFHVYAPTAR